MLMQTALKCMQTKGLTCLVGYTLPPAGSIHRILLVLYLKKSILVLIPEEYNAEPQAQFFRFKLIQPILKSRVNKAIMGTSLTILIILESDAEWMKA